MSPSARWSPPRAALFVWCVLLALSTCVVALAFDTRHCFVDDAFTDFQYLRNFLGGDGFVFHTGDAPVEGVTNIGWLLVLAPLCALATPMVVAKLAGLALVLMTLTLTVCLGQALASKTAHREDAFGLTLFPVLMSATSFELVYFSLAGMETGLLVTLLMLMACIALHRPHSLWLPALGAMAFLVHPEAVMVYPLYATITWWRAKDDRRALLVGGLILLGVVGGITAARFAYFGDVVPNTFHSKPSDVRAAVQNGYAFLMGQNTNVAFPITGWLAIPLLWLGYRQLRRAAPAAADMLAAIGGVGLAFAIYSPCDWTNLARYFAPYLPAALILLWAGLAEAMRLILGAAVGGHVGAAGKAVGTAVVLPRPEQRGGSTTATPTHTTATPTRESTQLMPRVGVGQIFAPAAVLLLVLTNVFDCQGKLARMEEFPGYVLSAKNLIGPAEWIGVHLPEDATIATRRIGLLAYHSHRRVFDYVYGLPDREVAQLVARRGWRFDTPTDSALEAVWRARTPDYLLEDGAVIDMIVAQAKGTRERFTIHGIPYGVVEQFSIGTDVQWVLARRIAAE